MESESTPRVLTFPIERVRKDPLSNTNRKYGPLVWHFTLPLSSCHFKTKTCNQYCFGKRIRNNVKERYQVNQQVSKEDEFVEYVLDQIKRKKIKHVRIHTIGDFYSQEYFEKWLDIIIEARKTKFLCYTRNADIVVPLPEALPRNFSLLYSLDDTTTQINPFIERFSYLLPCANDQVFKHKQVIEVELLGKMVICAGKCVNCRFCWNSKAQIAFPLVTTSRHMHREDHVKYHDRSYTQAEIKFR